MVPRYSQIVNAKLVVTSARTDLGSMDILISCENTTAALPFDVDVNRTLTMRTFSQAASIVWSPANWIKGEAYDIDVTSLISTMTYLPTWHPRASLVFRFSRPLPLSRYTPTQLNVTRVVRSGILESAPRLVILFGTGKEYGAVRSGDSSAPEYEILMCVGIAATRNSDACSNNGSFVDSKGRTCSYWSTAALANDCATLGAAAGMTAVAIADLINNCQVACSACAGESVAPYSRGRFCSSRSSADIIDLLF